MVGIAFLTCGRPGSALTRYDSGTHRTHVHSAAQARIVA